MAVKKAPALASTLAELRSKEAYRIGSLSEFDMTVRGLTIGNLTIDALTGCGGLPMGRVVELFGPESSGKTTTALQAAANLQAEPGCHHTGFWDHESALDERYVRALGIDPDAVCEECGSPKFLYEQPSSFERGAQLFRKLMPWLDLLVTDSVAAMVSEHELAADTGQVEVGVRGRLMYQYMRQVINPISRTGTCMVFLNHLQDVIDTSPMGRKLAGQGIKRTTTPGGRGLKFYASLRMSFQQTGNIKAEIFDPITNATVSLPRQTKTRVTVVKNKVGDPFGTAEVRVRFGKGFSQEWSALDVLVRHGVVKKDTGGVYRFVDSDVAPPAELADGEKSGARWIRGEDNVVARLERSGGWQARSVKKARELIAKGWDQKLSDDEQRELSDDEEPIEGVDASSAEVDGLLGQS
jgi:recombination protein RecA